MFQIYKFSNSNDADELCCIVVDEIHMLSDPHRGPTLELALAKMKQSKHAQYIQIIGMSATMGGAAQLPLGFCMHIQYKVHCHSACLQGRVALSMCCVVQGWMHSQGGSTADFS